MELVARDIMEKEFLTVNPEASVREAARLIFEGGVRKTGYKPFGLMVTDTTDALVGMISLYDILYHLRPPFMNYELESFKLEHGELEPYLDHFKELKVEEIMSTPVVTVDPDRDLMVIIDTMVKKKVRRLPVVADSKILGIVYLSDVFYHLCSLWLVCPSD
ncbi:MAG: CBS domain-containing protein [Desulfatiglandaceae bacterium]|jgi:CBS domain-containing protein